MYPVGCGSGKTWSRLSITKRKKKKETNIPWWYGYKNRVFDRVRIVCETAELAFLNVWDANLTFVLTLCPSLALGSPPVHLFYRQRSKGGLAKGTVWRVWFLMCCVIPTSMSLVSILGFIKKTQWALIYEKANNEAQIYSFLQSHDFKSAVNFCLLPKLYLES